MASRAAVYQAVRPLGLALYRLHPGFAAAHAGLCAFDGAVGAFDDGRRMRSAQVKPRWERSGDDADG